VSESIVGMSSDSPSTSSAVGRGRLILIVVGFWMLVGALYLISLILNAQQFGTGFELNPKTAAGTFATYLSWTLVSLSIIELLRRLDRDAAFIQVAGLLLAIALIWLPVSLAIDGLISDWIFEQPRRSPWTVLRQTNYLSVFFVAIFYMMVCFAAFGWIYLERWRQERERAIELSRLDIQNRLELADLQMQALKAQLSPHFLFNSLSSVSALARAAPRDRIIDAVQAIGDLLRYALSTSNQRTVNLESEIEFTQNYVSLQRLRFAERFDFQLHNGAPGHLACPPFVLQTLVENAFVHGVEASERFTKIVARIEISAAGLVFDVTNDHSEAADKTGGLGLALGNLERHLDLAFDRQAHCFWRIEGDQFRVQVRIPLKALCNE